MTNLNEKIGLSEKEDIITRINSSPQKATKYCKGCEETLILEECFYKSNTRTFFYQTLCKKCHNKVRNEHARNTERKKKPHGFQSLSMETQKSIIKDMFYYNKFRVEQGWDYNVSKIIKKYNEIKYHNFMNWIRKGKIPAYIETINS